MRFPGKIYSHPDSHQTALSLLCGVFPNSALVLVLSSLFPDGPTPHSHYYRHYRFFTPLSFCATRKLSRGEGARATLSLWWKLSRTIFPAFSWAVWECVVMWKVECKKKINFLPWYITSESEFWRRTAENCHPSVQKKEREENWCTQRVRMEGTRRRSCLVRFEAGKAEMLSVCVCFCWRGKWYLFLTSKSYAFFCWSTDLMLSQSCYKKFIKNVAFSFQTTQ